MFEITKTSIKEENILDLDDKNKTAFQRQQSNKGFSVELWPCG